MLDPMQVFAFNCSIAVYLHTSLAVWLIVPTVDHLQLIMSAFVTLSPLTMSAFVTLSPLTMSAFVTLSPLTTCAFVTLSPLTMSAFVTLSSLTMSAFIMTFVCCDACH